MYFALTTFLLLSITALIVSAIKPDFIIPRASRLKSCGFLGILVIFLLIPTIVLRYLPKNQTAVASASIVADDGLPQYTLAPDPTATATPSASPKPLDDNQAKVVRVIDGDTIEIEGGKKVKLIGVNAPETPSGISQCYGIEAARKHRELLIDKVVDLEADSQDADRYGRLLRYVYVEGLFVNEYLIQQGYASLAIYPPNTRRQDQLLTAQQDAQKVNKGIWGACNLAKGSLKTAADKASSQSAQSVLSATTSKPSMQPINSNDFSCAVTKICTQMTSCDEALYHFQICKTSGLDSDGDGVPCEDFCTGG